MDLSFLSLSFNPLLKTLYNGDYSNSAVLYSKSLPVRYSCLSNSFDDNADILAVSLS